MTPLREAAAAAPTTLHFGRNRQPYVLLPIVPPTKQAGKTAKHK